MIIFHSLFFILYIFFLPGSGQSQTSRGSKNGSTLGYNAPDLTSGVHNVNGNGNSNTGNEYNFGSGTYHSDKNSNCSSSHKINGMSTPIPGLTPFSEFRPMSEHFYEQPMVPIKAQQKNNR